MSGWWQVGATTVAAVAAAVAAGGAWKTAQETKRLADDNFKQSEALRTPNLIVSGGYDPIKYDYVKIRNWSLHAIFISLVKVIPEGSSGSDVEGPVFFNLYDVKSRSPNGYREADAIDRAILQPEKEKPYNGGWSGLITPGSNESILCTLRITFNYPMHSQGPLSWDVPCKVSPVEGGGLSLLIRSDQAAVGDPAKPPEVRYKEL